MARKKPLPRPFDNTRSNVEAIVRLEEEQDRQLSTGERLSAVIAGFVGSIPFVVLQVAFLTIWVVANLAVVPGMRPFDPEPFPLLWGIFTFEAVVMTAFVLIQQNTMNRRAEHRSHLDLQINLLSEQAATKVIQMLDRMSKKLGIEDEVIDREAKELAKETAIEAVSHELRESLEVAAGKPPDQPSESPQDAPSRQR